MAVPALPALSITSPDAAPEGYCAALGLISDPPLETPGAHATSPDPAIPLPTSSVCDEFPFQPFAVRFEMAVATAAAAAAPA